jgi:hypothetical protein
VLIAEQRAGLAEMAMRMHVDGLDALAVDADGEFLPWRLRVSAVNHAAAAKHDAGASHIPNTATARIGEAVPSRIFSGSPMKVNGPAPNSASRLHRLSIWVMSRSRQALCTSELTLPSGPGRIESMPKCTTPRPASHSVAATFTPEFSLEYSLRGKVRA